MKFVDELLTGDERLVSNNQELPYDVKRYWQLNLSTLLLNMTRGGFAEYLVQCALDADGFKCLDQVKDGTEAWDVDGPEIHIAGEEPRLSRIEVKSAASVQIYSPDDEEISLPENQLRFSIRPARDWRSSDEGQHRNNDLYVFCHYKAKRKTDNMLDMGFWDFYVYPTFMINNNPSLCPQKTISVRRLHMLGVEPQSFDTLGPAIRNALKLIEEHK